MAELPRTPDKTPSEFQILLTDAVKSKSPLDVICRIAAMCGKETERPLTEAVQAVMDGGGDGAMMLAVVEAMEKAPRRRPASVNGRIWPTGPKERWGYEGPITPRLPERDWWPLRNSILRRDGYVCHYCGVTDAQWCADHVVPLSRGGTNEPDNLVACCFACNSSKADRLVSEWRGRVR